MAMMQAKMKVDSINRTEYAEEVKFSAVYSGEKNSEDNTFSSATPSASLTMTISNKALWGKLNPGQKFYLNFSEAES